MDPNGNASWLDAPLAPVGDAWLESGCGTANVPGRDDAVIEGEHRDRGTPEASTPIVIHRVDAPVTGSTRLGYFAVCGAGLILSVLAVYLSMRVLPRFALVQQRYGFVLPWETRVALRSGMLQPIPGCMVLLAGLTGLLTRSPSRRHAIVTAILLLIAIAAPVATAVTLLLPELTLV